MPTSPDERALLEAIHGARGEDTPRLAYADWLDEHGDPARASFIRLQIELAAHSPYDVRANPLREREKALLDAHQEQWSIVYAPAEDVTFRRGFAETVSVSIGELAANSEMLAAAPFECLRLNSTGHTAVAVRALASNSLLARVPELFVGGWKPAELRPLLRSPHLTGLMGLHFDDDCCTPQFARLLAGCENLRSIVHIGFYGDYDGRLGDRGAGWLARAAHLACVRSLNLQNNQLTGAALESLAGSKYLTNLENLALGWGSYNLNQIGPDGAEAIAGSANFTKLASIDFGFNPVGNEGMVALSGSRELAAMESLNLPHCGVGDGGVTAFATDRGMPRLHFLNVSGGGLTDDGLTELARSPRLASLTELKAGSTPVGDAGARALADSPHATNLKALNLHECRLTKVGVEALIDSPNLRGLDELSISTGGLPKTLQARVRERFGD